jgi:hypothetical protein
VGAWEHWIGGGFDPRGLGGLATLSLAMVFFALKIVDVPWLRLRTDHRSLVAMGLVVALLHVDVIRPDTAVANVPEYTTLVASTLLVAGALRRSRRYMNTSRCASRDVASMSPLLRSNETAWLDAFRPHCWVLASRLYLLRAPPA